MIFSYSDYVPAKYVSLHLGMAPWSRWLTVVIAIGMDQKEL